MNHAVAVLFLTSLVVAAPAVQDPKPKSPQEARAAWLAEFKQYLVALDLTSLEAIDAAHKRIENEKRPDPKKKDDVSGWLGSEIDAYVKTRSRVMASAKDRLLKLTGLRFKLDAMEIQAKDIADLAAATRLWRVLQDVDLRKQAAEAGGDHQKRLNVLRRTVGERYEPLLQGAAAKALGEATSSEAMAPMGEYEDLLRVLHDEATAANDQVAVDRVAPLLTEYLNRSDAKVKELFGKAYIREQPWVDLLDDRRKWQEAGDAKVVAKFDTELVLHNEAGEDRRSAGLSYSPGNDWRDYVLELDLTLESGVLGVYMRVGDAMDSKMVPAFFVGPERNRNVVVDAGARTRLVATVIGSEVSVVGSGTVLWSDPNVRPKSRKGEPGLVVQPGTKVTIHSLRARWLR